MRGKRQGVPTVRTGRLQTWLLSEKRRSGLSFAELAARTYTSRSSLHRATRGAGLPSREVFDAFVAGCGSDVAAAEEHWRWAKLLAGPSFAWELTRTRPESVTTHGELRQALEWLTDKSARSLRQLERQAQARGGRLRRSTVSDALHGRHNFGRALVAELARACGEPEDAVTAWDEAWQRAERDRRGRTGHLGAVRRLPPEARDLIECGVGEMFRMGDQYGVPETEVEVYIRHCAESERRWGHRITWHEVPEAWTRATAGTGTSLSRRLEAAVSSVLAEDRGQVIDGASTGEVIRAVLSVLAGETLETSAANVPQSAS
ncbi:helix-turn-helix domain-containing protein [Streptomyces sp. NPDC088190]|uniref:helix-turn-helix domain-containing protein n=1 Tax=unclassified Streptomyces TaxID=2593676 RepID=UPI00381DE34A